MMHALFFFFSLPTFAVQAFACEGQCIIDITHAFVGNYSVPVQHVFAEAAANLARYILPSRSIAIASKIMQPLLDAYDRGAYDAMEKAIFPSYFHGKCQVNGVDPKGCPNPDCPVVCGTPGSLVHFYNVLQDIAFNTTSANLLNLCAPSSNTYKTLEAAVLHDLRNGTPSRRSLRSSIRASPRHHNKRAEISESRARTLLQSLCKGTAKDLARVCGGKADLPNCSWETEMKVRELILKKKSAAQPWVA